MLYPTVDALPSIYRTPKVLALYKKLDDHVAKRPVHGDLGSCSMKAYSEWSKASTAWSKERGIIEVDIAIAFQRIDDHLAALRAGKAS